MTKSCLNCGEVTDEAATVCAACGHAFSPAGVRGSMAMIRDCPICKEVAAEADARCRICGHTFSGTPARAGVVPAPIATTIKRPDGGGLMGLGVACGIAGLLALVVFGFQSASRGAPDPIYGPPDPATYLLLGLGGGSLVSVGLLFWLTGYIVRAMSFLPVDADRVRPEFARHNRTEVGR